MLDVDIFNPEKIYAEWIILADDNFNEAIDLMNKRNKAFFPEPYLKDIIFFKQELTRRWSEEQGEYLLLPKASEDESTWCYGLACAYYPRGHPEKAKAVKRGWPWDSGQAQENNADWSCC